jgi:uncharacterized membrane protein
MNVKSSIQWATPYSLGLIVALAATALLVFALWRWSSGKPIEPARRRGLWALRLLILAVLIPILLNPVRVDETPGAVERPRVLYLVDASQSMALGKGSSRWDQVVQTMREADRSHDPRVGAQVSVFRFGARLAAVGGPFWEPPEPPPTARAAPGAVLAADPPRPSEPVPAPTDDDTVLAGSLESLASRFGQNAPQAVVLFSDGRARDPERVEPIARAYGKMKVPIHVYPVGDEQVGGDVAIVSMVAPSLARKHTQLSAQVYVRSYGYKGKRAELKLVPIGPDGAAGPPIARTPIVLQDGMTPYTLAFESGDQDRRLEARIDTQPGEASAANNAFAAELAIDHTKIRVLYLEGSSESYVVRQGIFGLGGSETRGAFWSLQQALMEDPDIECTAVMPGGAGGDFSVLVRTDERGRGLPETPSELFAYDAIILSNVPREALSDQHLAWVEEWIGKRGGGLCMVGGPLSFSSGLWNDSTVGKMLPAELLPTGRDWDESMVTVVPSTDGPIHPIWHISSDEAKNKEILKTLPSFQGSNRVGRVKTNADVLARGGTTGSTGEPPPIIAVQPYGRGRAMMMTTAITRRFATAFSQSWGGSDSPYYKKFWRNTIYWLTENSSIGRRRLLAETDKTLYRPGEQIVIRSKTFDENASQTLEYRVAVSIEPKSAAGATSDESPLRRPVGTPRPAEGQGPLLPWGEEFDLARQTGEKSYTATLPIADAKSLPTGVTLTQGLRIELTAYENNTQVDSTALEVQVLDDPSEQQNPLPDHDLLRRVAAQSGGTVLGGSKDLAAMVEHLPRIIGAPEIKKVPVWSRWWLLSLLIVLLTIEWVWRRRIGLA